MTVLEVIVFQVIGPTQNATALTKLVGSPIENVKNGRNSIGSRGTLPGSIGSEHLRLVRMEEGVLTVRTLKVATVDEFGEVQLVF